MDSENLIKNFDVIPVGRDFHSSYPIARDCLENIQDYVMDEGPQHRICAIYGLRRTGKTVLMTQSIAALPGEKKDKAVFLICSQKTDFYDVLAYIKAKIGEGSRYFFLDEITYADNFIQVGEVLSSLVTVYGDVRFVVTGTDSLGLSLPKKGTQYDRTCFVHTTYIPFGEYQRITGCGTLDDFIKNGSVLVPGIFSTYDDTHDYIQTSITENLIHSLEKSEGMRRYPMQLTEIYERQELQNVIERIINGYSQALSAKAIRKEFSAGTVGASIKNLAKRVENPENYKELLHRKELDAAIGQALGVLKNEELSVQVTDEHRDAVYAFLKEMDVFLEVPVHASLDGPEEEPVIMASHPGICHANIRHTMEELKRDGHWFPEAAREQREKLLEASGQYAMGVLMENIVLGDAFHLLCPDTANGKGPSRWYVSRLHTRLEGNDMEADVIIVDREQKQSYLFEVKHSAEVIPEQSDYLEDDGFLSYVKKEFAPVRKQAVLYTGKTDTEPAIPRINATDFLILLYQTHGHPDFSMDKLMDTLTGHASPGEGQDGQKTGADEETSAAGQKNEKLEENASHNTPADTTAEVSEESEEDVLLD